MEMRLRDVEFQVDTSLHPFFWESISTKPWETGTFDVIDQFVQPGDSVADIGCWMGPISLYLAGKGARVYAADPDPTAYKAFQSNLSLNPTLSTLITPHHLAIAPQRGTFTLYARTGYGNSSSSLLARTRDQVQDSTTLGLTLAEFMEQNAVARFSLIKLDIEGGEFALAEQLLALKQADRYGHLLLSMHYDHLNESIYQQQIFGRWLSKAFMKVERITGRYLFRRRLRQTLEPIVSLCRQFPYVYTMEGQRLSPEQLSAQQLLRSGADLFLADQPWEMI